MNSNVRRDFAGQVAIVTGAAQGIGRATAVELADRGAEVVMVDIAGDLLAVAAEKLSGQGARVRAHVADLTQEDQVASLVDTTIQAHGRIDVLANIAAIYPFIPIDQLTLTDFHRVLAANIDSTFLCSKLVLPQMRTQHYGRIINTASGTFANPEPGLSAYVTSKGAVIGFTRQLSREAGEGITVNVVMPGLIATDHTLTMLDSTADTDAFFDKLIEKQSVKRRGLPEDIATCIAYVASRDAGFVTGQILDVGGGATYH